jgi:bacterioferritin-associated ferredoxin
VTDVLLCHCRGVSDRVIDCAIACGARSVEEVAAACGAGARCGGCVPAIDQLLEARLPELLVAVARPA